MMQISRALLIAALAIVWFVPTASAQAVASSRHALVIANSDYPGNSRDLANPESDATLIAGTLGALGFEVTQLRNLGRQVMLRDIATFAQRLPAGALALVYYAGHGVQVGSQNYLLPTDAEIDQSALVPLRSVPLQTVLDRLSDSAATVNVVIIDACRNNPFIDPAGVRYRSWNTTKDGLAPVDVPRGTLVAYSTAPGELAADGKGRNSLYTTTLASLLAQPGLPLDQVFRRAAAAVRLQTKDAQRPWYESSLSSDVVLRPSNVAQGQGQLDAAKPTYTLPQQPSVVVQPKLSNFDWRQRQMDVDWRVKNFTPDEIKPTEGKARAGDVDAMLILGLVYMKGKEPNNTQAVKWLGQAAAKGEPIAQTAFGEMLFDGRGGTRDVKEAERLFGLAAATGYPGGTLNLAQLRMKLDPSGENQRQFLMRLGYPDPDTLMKLLK